MKTRRPTARDWDRMAMPTRPMTADETAHVLAPPVPDPPTRPPIPLEDAKKLAWLSSHAWHGGTRCLRCGAARRSRGSRVEIQPNTTPRTTDERYLPDGWLPRGHMEAFCFWVASDREPFVLELRGQGERLGMTLPADMKRRLEAQAVVEGRSLANLLRVLLEGAILRVDFGAAGWDVRWLKGGRKR